MGKEPRRYHGNALRKGRVSLPRHAYLVTAVTSEREPLFLDFECARLLARTLYVESDEAATLAYVIMPDHLHWLLRLKSEKTLSAVLHRVKNVSAHGINRRLQRSGAVWQQGFHDHAVRSDEDLRQLARYVIANPLRAGLVSDVRDYSYWDAVWL